MRPKKKILHIAVALVAFAVAAAVSPVSAQTCHVSDTYIDGSLCVGFDCVCSSAFGFDTIILRENNTRFFFDDTTAAAGFPNNDWRLTANDSSSGGRNYFSIDDVTSGKTPFLIEANAPTNTLYVASEGRIGVNTANPVVDIHVVQGNTATLRLEQDGSSGFTSQTWDIAGNETNFFIRDVTSGSKLPFRIKPGAPDDSIFIKGDGKVGLGTDAPSATLQVAGDAVVDGDFSAGSSRQIKRDFEPVEPRAILDRLLELPVTEWSYRDGSPEARHMGPVAEEFSVAFGLGRDDRHVSPVDLSGVAFAAIQGLHEVVRERDDEIAQLERSRDELAARLDALERRLVEAHP